VNKCKPLGDGETFQDSEEVKKNKNVEDSLGLDKQAFLKDIPWAGGELGLKMEKEIKFEVGA